MLTDTIQTTRRRSKKRIGVVTPKEFCRALWEKRRVLAGPSTPLGIQTLQLGILLTHFIRANLDQFAFEEQLEYAEGAARFLTGTPNPAAHMAGTAGYDLIEEIGVERIRENSLHQTQLLIDLADDSGFAVHSTRDPRRRGGAVIVNVPEAAAVYAELEQRGILGDFRPGAGIRLGPHFFTADDEIRFAIAQIAEILETGAHERHLGAVALH